METLVFGAGKGHGNAHSILSPLCEHPAAVQWYCALKLELALHLIVDVLTRQLRSQTTPGLQEAQSSLCQVLQDRLGSAVHVDDVDLPDLRYFGFVDDYPNS